MKDIPFNFYDFFGYLAPGFVILVVLGFVVFGPLVLLINPGVVSGTLVIGAAYLIGHILSGPSIWLLERIVAKGWLEAPSVNLFWHGPRGRCTKFVFGYYMKPLPRQIAKEVLERARKEGYEFPQLRLLLEKASKDKEEKKKAKEEMKRIKKERKKIGKEGHRLYLHAYVKVKKDAVAMTLQDRFLGLYGFGRNTSFSFLCASVITLIFYVPAKWAFLCLTASIGMSSCYVRLLSTEGIFAFCTPALWFISCSFACVVMFFCYLKFYRLYYRELFFAYLESAPEGPDKEIKRINIVRILRR